MTVISEEESDNSQNSILSNVSQTQSPSIDADLSRLENQMNSWSLDFKRNILVCLNSFPTGDIVFCNKSFFNMNAHTYNIINPIRSHIT